MALYSDLLLDVDVLAFVLECAIGFVVRWRSCTTESYCEAVADAEACERLLFGVLRFEGPDFEDEGGIEDEEVEGDGSW